MHTDSFDVEVAARTCWAEARGEGEPGMRAVAWAIINRFDAEKWFSGQTIAECCLKPWQFSAWNTEDPNRAQIARLADDDVTLVLCRGYVQSALMNVGDDPTRGSTHYKRVGTEAKWADGLQPQIVIGHHEFYKGVA